jgi:hypothetical protein
MKKGGGDKNMKVEYKELDKVSLKNGRHRRKE